MEASRTAESELSRCKKELSEVAVQRRRQRNLYLAARDERNAVGKNAARGCISIQIMKLSLLIHGCLNVEISKYYTGMKSAHNFEDIIQLRRAKS